MSTQSTALILRPSTSPRLHILECDGPDGFPAVNRTVGNFRPVMDYDEWLALPDHQKSIEPSGAVIEIDAAARVSRIIENADRVGYLTRRHIREIQWRLEIACPSSTGDLLRTPGNQ